MPIQYRVQKVPASNPPKYYAQVVEDGVVDEDAAAADIAEKTQQTEAVVRAVLGGARQVIEQGILAGRGVYLPDIGKVTASIEATLPAMEDPLPDDVRVRARAVLERSILDSINDTVQYERLEADNMSPFIQNVIVENGVITQMTPAALITLRGSRLEMDVDAADQGVYLLSDAGAVTKLPKEKIRTHTEGQVEFFWADGMPAGTDFSVYIKGARAGSLLVRESNHVSGFATE